MTPELTELARRLVACPRWRWIPGMLWSIGPQPGWVRASTGRVLSAHEDGGPVRAPRSCLPDLTDPATLGCILALVREAWRCPTVYVRQSTSRRVSDGAFAWEVCDLWVDAEACRALGVDRQGSVGSWGAGSEAEALVDALEAAP